MRWFRAASLKGRILRNVVAGALLAAACHAVAVSVLYRAGSEAMVHSGLEGQAEDIEERLSFDSQGAPVLALESHMQEGYDAYFLHLQYRVLDVGGRVLLSSHGDPYPLVRQGGAFVPGPDRFAIVRDGESMQVATVAALVDGRALWIQTGRSDRFLALTEEALLPVMVDTSLLAGAIALALFGTVVWISLVRALAPVRGASATAAGIGPRNPGARVRRNDLPDEILPLVDAVNGGLARLERAYLAQQRFIANAAHELKTPLALLRGRIELEGDARCKGTALAEIDAMARIVAQLLHLAEASDPSTYRRASFCLHAVASRARQLVAPAADARQIAIDVVASGLGPTLVGDASALVAAVRNLLENAVRHAPHGSVIEVQVDAGVLTVRDRGAGLSTEALNRMFERFWRADRNGEGAGLGLAIVREVVEAHGGEVSGRNRTDGAGAEFRIALPVQSPR